MKIEARHIVAALLLWFAWKGNTLDLSWPPAGMERIVSPKVTPSEEHAKWCQGVQKIAATMIPPDRIYLSHLYDAMAFVLLRDFDRTDPIVTTTDSFSSFHGGTLALAIDKAKVGKYPGLDKAIDAAFFAALGVSDPSAGIESKALTKEEKQRLVAACGVLSYTFEIGRDE